MYFFFFFFRGQCQAGLEIKYLDHTAAFTFSLKCSIKHFRDAIQRCVGFTENNYWTIKWVIKWEFSLPDFQLLLNRDQIGKKKKICFEFEVDGVIRG